MDPPIPQIPAWQVEQYGERAKERVQSSLRDGLQLLREQEQWRKEQAVSTAMVFEHRFLEGQSRTLEAELFNSCDADFCSTTAKCPSSFWSSDYKKCKSNCYYCYCKDCVSRIYATSVVL